MSDARQDLAALTSETLRLATACLSDDIDTADLERLNELLDNNEVARVAYLRFMSDSQSIRTWIADHEPPAIEIRVSKPRQRAWHVAYDVASNYITLSLLISTIVMTIIVLSMGLIVPDWNPEEVVRPDTRFIAEITNTHQATFDQSSIANLKNRSLFAGGDLILKSGLVEVTYDTGVRVVLEGPATYKIVGEKSGSLQVGKLAARVVGEEAKGFFVDVPWGRVIDLGTEFGINVQPHGVAEIVVLSGKVDYVHEARDGGPNQRIGLDEGQGVSVKPDGTMIHRQQIDPRFVEDYRRRIDQPLSTIARSISDLASAIASFDMGNGPGETGFAMVPGDLKEFETTSGDITLTLSQTEKDTARDDGDGHGPAHESRFPDLLRDFIHADTFPERENQITLVLSGLEKETPYRLRWYHYESRRAIGKFFTSVYRDVPDVADNQLFQVISPDTDENPSKTGFTEFLVRSNKEGRVTLVTGHALKDGEPVERAICFLNGLMIFAAGETLVTEQE